MNVEEDKMALNYYVPVLFRVKYKRENILLDLVKREVQLSNYKHDIRNSKWSVPYLFRRTRTRDSQSIQESGFFL